MMKPKMLYLLALVVCCMLHQSSHSQDTLTKSMRVTFAPLNLLDPYAGVVQVGVQKRVSRRIAFALDYGLRFNTLSYGRRSLGRNDYRYYKAKAEMKYFLHINRQTTGVNNRLYLSLQGFYFPQQYRKDNGWLVREGKTYQFTSSQIDRKAVSFSVLTGKEVIKGQYTLDIYIGLGYRNLTIKHHMEGAVAGNRPEPKEPSLRPIDEKEGNFDRPHVALGIKMGYDF